MNNKLIIIFIINLSALSAFSQSPGNLFIVENNTQKVINSIVLNEGDSGTYCAYIIVIMENEDDIWIRVPAKWFLPPPLEDFFPTFGFVPYEGFCLTVTGKIPLKDTIIVKGEIDSLIIPITILPGPFLPKFNISLITPPQKRIIGDTIKAEVSIWNKDGPVPGDVCIDSIYYDLPGDIQKDSLSVILVDSWKRGFNTYVDQCFHNGRDTIGIIIKDGSSVEKTFSISVSCRWSTDTSEKAILLPVSSKPNRVKSVNIPELVNVTNGFIRFGKGFEVPLVITITNINGQLIHKGVYIPDKSQSQYPLPASMMSHGCFILTIGSQKSGLVYSGVILHRD